jgi:hypothetical protein
MHENLDPARIPGLEQELAETMKLETLAQAARDSHLKAFEDARAEASKHESRIIEIRALLKKLYTK